MKILVTGATGFIGGSLSNALVKKGYFVRCLVRKGSNIQSLRGTGVELIYGELDNKKQLINATKDINTVFHLAGNVYSLRVNELYQTNVIGTRNLLRACAQNRISKFIFLSSIAAMGPSKDGQALNEESPCAPVTAYGKSKLEAEKMLAQSNNNHHFPIVVVRAPTIYGPGVSCQSRVFFFLEAIRKKKFRIIGKGDNLVSICYIDDLVLGLIAIHEEERICSTTYLLSSDQSYPLKEIAEKIAALENAKFPRIKVPLILVKCLLRVLALGGKEKKIFLPITQQMLEEITNDWIVDISKAKKEIGYHPTFNLHDGMKQTVEWYINQCESSLYE